ncbi:MAG: YihY/virulence factor BrkB family protein [Flavobacteriales bacterium]|jgi:membrane protein|nr:YihY/virulence factor BrkB family protein [Flavobacteriales bacterium]
MWSRIRRRILFSRATRNALRWAHAAKPPGFEGFSVYEIARFFFAALTKGHLVTRAAAIAFKLFLALFPALIVLLTLIPYVPITDFQARLLGSFREMMPGEVFRFIENTLEDLLVRKHGTLLSISFVTGLFFASNSINAILEGFSRSTNLARWHSPLKQRLLSLGLLLALTMVGVLAVPLLTVSGSVIRWLEDAGLLLSGVQVFLAFAVKWAVTILLVTFSVSLLYNVGDPGNRRFRIFTPGSMLAVALVILVSQALAWFFNNITNYNALYGSIGAILAVQLWIYINMIVLLVGYELNISIARARRSRAGTLRPREEAP